MPFYDFKCKCGYVWNDHRISNSDVKVPCPKCNETMERQFPLTVNMKWDKMIAAYMAPPQHIIDNPTEYYR